MAKSAASLKWGVGPRRLRLARNRADALRMGDTPKPFLVRASGSVPTKTLVGATLILCANMHDRTRTRSHTALGRAQSRWIESPKVPHAEIAGPEKREHS